MSSFLKSLNSSLIVLSPHLSAVTEAEAARLRKSVGFVTVVAIVVVILIVIVIVIDISCYFLNGCGLTMFVCVHCCGKDKPKDMGSDEEAEERCLFNSGL